MTKKSISDFVYWHIFSLTIYLAGWLNHDDSPILGLLCLSVGMAIGSCLFQIFKIRNQHKAKIFFQKEKTNKWIQRNKDKP